MLTDPSNNVIPANLNYDPSTQTATLSPRSHALSYGTTYTATLSGTQDLSGNTMAPVSWSFTTSSLTIWSSTAAPTVSSANDPNSIEVGLKFESTTAGYVTGIRFYKGSGNTGTHVGYLWDANGNLLATATFTDETDSGWQEVDFDAPVAIEPNTVYVASYFAPNGHYAGDSGYFATSETHNGPLRALSSPESGGNGVFVYGSNGGFPTNSFNAANYWVDIDFTPCLTLRLLRCSALARRREQPTWRRVRASRPHSVNQCSSARSRFVFDGSLQQRHPSIVDIRPEYPDGDVHAGVATR